MDQDQLRDARTRARGSVKEAIGKVTGIAATEVEGVAQTSAGRVRRVVGPANDEARTALNGDE